MPIYSNQDLLRIAATAKPSTWIVDGLLRAGRGRPSLITGTPHAGKSTLGIQLVKAVASGEDFLGRKTQQSPTLYWASEDTPEDMADDFVANTIGGDPFHVAAPEAGVDNLVTLSKYLEYVPGIRLCVIENLSSFFGLDDVKNNSELEKAIKRFKELTADYPDCCFIIIHWSRKSDGQKSSLTINNILGATSIAGNTDTILDVRIASNDDQRRIIQAIVRGSKKSGKRNIDPTYVYFDEATAKSELDVTVEEAKTEEQVIVADKNRLSKQDGLRFAIEQNPGLSQNALYAKVGGNKKKFIETLEALESEKTIRREFKQGVRKNETLLFPVELF